MDISKLAYVSGFPFTMEKEKLVEFIKSNLGKETFEKVSISKNRTFAIVFFSDRNKLGEACGKLDGLIIAGEKFVFRERPPAAIIFEMILNERDWIIICMWIKKKIVSPKQSFVSSLDRRTSLLHLAVIDENLHAIDTFLFAGVNIDVEDLQERTPVHYACIFGRLKSLKRLVSRGAQLSIPDSKRNTPLHYASVYGFNLHVEIIVRNLGFMKGLPQRNRRKKTPQDLWTRGNKGLFSKYEKVQVAGYNKVIFKCDRAHALLFARDPYDRLIKVLLQKQHVKQFPNRYFCRKRVVVIDQVEYIFLLYYYESLYQYYIVVKNTKTGEIFYCQDVSRKVWKRFFNLPSSQNDPHHVPVENEAIQFPFQSQSGTGMEDVQIRENMYVDFCIYLPKMDTELHFYQDPNLCEIVCEFDPLRDVDDIRASVARAVSAQTYGALANHHQKKSREKLRTIIKDGETSILHNVSLSSLRMTPFFFLHVDYIPLDDLDPRHYTGQGGLPPLSYQWISLGDIFAMMRQKLWEVNHKNNEEEEEDIEEVEGEDEESENEPKIEEVPRTTTTISSIKRRMKIPKDMEEFIILCMKIPDMMKRMKSYLILPNSLWEKIIFEYCDLKVLCKLRGTCRYLREVCYKSKNVDFDETIGHPKFLLTYFLHARSIKIIHPKNFHEFVFQHISQNSDLQEISVHYEISPVLMNEVVGVLLRNSSFRALSMRNCEKLNDFTFLGVMLGLNTCNKYIKRIELGGILDRRVQHHVVEVLTSKTDLMELGTLVLWDMDLLGMYRIWRNFMYRVKVQHLILNISGFQYAKDEMEKYEEREWFELERLWEGIFHAMEGNSCLIEVSSNIPTLNIIAKRTQVLQNVTVNIPIEMLSKEELAELEEEERDLAMSLKEAGQDGGWAEGREPGDFGLEQDALFIDSSSDEDLTERDFMEGRDRIVKRLEVSEEMEKLSKKANTQKGERDSRAIAALIVTLLSILSAFLFFRDI